MERVKQELRLARRPNGPYRAQHLRVPCKTQDRHPPPAPHITTFLQPRGSPARSLRLSGCSAAASPDRGSLLPPGTADCESAARTQVPSSANLAGRYAETFALKAAAERASWRCARPRGLLRCHAHTSALMTTSAPATADGPLIPRCSIVPPCDPPTESSACV